ncbi:MAG: hypothetical protein PHE17_09585 [Thiothrix sp.]|uniref:hypothetical protein n=1 Tax=Thiothrix sp. TaxID=1032 RepID=UPI0026111E20|nr:hypothetical protein [Thiothrix sp.]MDD5393258.1 hypothetical protein [Thiothrix sp.]
MGGNVKLMVGGILLGVVVLFALVGIKSMLGSSDPTLVDGQTPVIGTPYPSANTPILGLPSDNAGVSSLGDKPLSQIDAGQKVELVNEPDTTKPATEDRPLTTSRPTPAPTPSLGSSVLPGVQTPAPVAPPVANVGKLTVVVQEEESGRALNANIYVQRPNGMQVNQVDYISTAAFNLKPGTYRITARAEGRASVSRNISVAANTAVNEVFALPVSTPVASPEPAQPMQPWSSVVGQNPAIEPQVVPVPEPLRPAPPAQNAEKGKLRLVALSADDGSPVAVNFTITRLDGSVVNQINDVPVAELTLPAEEFVVSFNYQGKQGYKSLTVEPGQTHTHTFNIQGGQQSDPSAMGMSDMLQRMR